MSPGHSNSGYYQTPYDPAQYQAPSQYTPLHGASTESGPSRWQGDAHAAASIAYNRSNQDIPYNPPMFHSPPMHQFHPSSYGPNYPFSAVALGANSSNGSSNLGMSISPPSYIPGNAPWGGSGSYVGSFGAMGTSFGRERDRELEAKYVRDFTCCNRQLNGLHELLEHYEEEHANLPPELRIAAINAAQNGVASTPARATMSYAPPTPVSMINLQQSAHGDAPTPPGMMDIEMDEQQLMPGVMLNATSPTTRMPLPPSNPSSPWATAFRPQLTSSQGVPPSLLSFSGPGYPSPSLSVEQLEAKALKKAQRKAERLAREETAISDAEGDKRFPCPIEGCGKVYKQANGLKYHLTRSINSGHGNVAALGLAALLGDRPGEGSAG